jgi:hypothetical protein
MQLGKTSYESYFNRLYKSSSLHQQTKQSLLSMYQTILDELTVDEEKELGIYVEVDNTLTQQQEEAALLQDPDFIFYCKIISIGTIKFFVILNMKSTYRFIPGKKYLFDLQDETNLGYQFSLSPFKYSYTDAVGIDIIGTSGTPGAFVVFRPQEWFDSYIQQYSLYSYNKLDSTRNSYNLFPLFYQQLYVKLNYLTLEESFDSSGTPFSYQSFGKDTSIECLLGSTFLKTTTYKGIKYYLEQEISDYTGNAIIGRYNKDLQYGLYYGTYTIFVQAWDPITIINKDKSNLIDISGEYSNMSVIYLNGLGVNSADTSLDGSYNFFHGNVQIIVAGNFDTCPVYSSQLGFNSMDNMFVFASNCYDNAQARTHFESITTTNLECLYPETNCQFDISNGVSYILFNGNTSYDSTKKYALSEGQYILLNIPEDHPIAFINKGKESYFQYEGVETTGMVRMGPDDNEYTFYYGTIVIRIYGDFGNISVYDFYNGYTGGYQLFQYSDVCQYDGMWISDTGYQDTPSNTDIVEYESGNPIVIYDVDSYIQFVYDTSYIYVSDAGINQDIKYGFNIGNYVILDVPESHPIAFLNSGYENTFMYDGYFPYKVSGIGPDGEIYDFYYGNINLYVTGNFGQVSFCVLNRDYLNGRNKFIFSESSSGGFALPNNGIFNLYPQLTSSIDNGMETFYIKVYLETIELPYSRDIENFHFQGSDRNGIINLNESNPELTFFIGDTVKFAFMYSNTSNTIGISVYNQLIEDEQLITFNNNVINENIEWKPNLSLQNYYFYRSNSHDLTFNMIQILPNSGANLFIDISNISPSDGDTTVSVTLDTFTFETTMLLNRIDSTKRIHLIDESNVILKSYDLTETGVSSFTISSGLSITDRMDFNTTYSLVIDEGMFQNIYLKDFEDVSLTTFTTADYEPIQLLSIEPSNGMIYSWEPVILSFNTPISLHASHEIHFYDISNGTNINYSSIEVSGNDLYMYGGYLVNDLSYQVVFGSISIMDQYNVIYNDPSGSLLDTYEFYVQNHSQPEIISTNPTFGETDVSADSTIEIVFDDLVLPTNQGSIVIQDLSNAVPFLSIDLSTTTLDTSIISIEDNNTIRIDPSVNFTSGTTYAVLIDSTAISTVVLGENTPHYFAGISDESFYTFTIQTDTTTTATITSTNPIITLIGDNPMTIFQGDSYTEPGFTAVNALGINISDDVSVFGTIVSNIIGTYTLVYDVSDSSGNEAITITRTVNVISTDIVTPTITLLGDASMTLFQGDVYTELGANATDDVDGDISNTVIITGTVDTSTIGVYNLAYNVSDAAGNQASTATRTVNVVVAPDTVAPTIILVGDASMTLFQGDVYTELGANATDDADGDISNNVIITGTVDTSTIGVYNIAYDVSDAVGNQASTVIRTVIIVEDMTFPSLTDTVAPTITLVGDASMTLFQGDVYTELGANATDDVNGDISNNVIITGTVDTSTIGVYNLAYDVSDAAGNQASTVIRTVDIVASIILQLLSQSSNNEVDIEATDTGNKYIFNDISYDSDKIIGLTNGDYVLENISDAHPIAVLNGSTSNISYSPVNDSLIIIKVSGGSFFAPFYTFTDENDNNISSDIFSGTYKFMRGRTYQFNANGISSSHPFMIHSNKGETASSSMTGSGSSITVTMTNDDNEASYYACETHSFMQGYLNFFYANAPDGNEYNFYYGNVNISVSGDFGTISYYCFYHGYMGGENRLSYYSG